MVVVQFRLYPTATFTNAQLTSATAASQQTSILSNLMTFSSLIADWFTNNGEQAAPACASQS